MNYQRNNSSANNKSYWADSYRSSKTNLKVILAKTFQGGQSDKLLCKRTAKANGKPLKSRRVAKIIERCREPGRISTIVFILQALSYHPIVEIRCKAIHIQLLIIESFEDSFIIKFGIFPKTNDAHSINPVMNKTFTNLSIITTHRCQIERLTSMSFDTVKRSAQHIPRAIQLTCLQESWLALNQICDNLPSGKDHNLAGYGWDAFRFIVRHTAHICSIIQTIDYGLSVCMDISDEEKNFLVMLHENYIDKYSIIVRFNEDADLGQIIKPPNSLQTLKDHYRSLNKSIIGIYNEQSYSNKPNPIPSMLPPNQLLQPPIESISDMCQVSKSTQICGCNRTPLYYAPQFDFPKASNEIISTQGIRENQDNIFNIEPIGLVEHIHNLPPITDKLTEFPRNDDKAHAGDIDDDFENLFREAVSTMEPAVQFQNTSNEFTTLNTALDTTSKLRSTSSASNLNNMKDDEYDKLFQFTKRYSQRDILH